MTENKSFEDFELHRHVLKATAAAGEADWAATVALPTDDAYELRGQERKGNGLAFCAVLVDGNGAKVATGSCLVTFEVVEIVERAAGLSQVAVGGDLIGPIAPYKMVLLTGENAPGKGNYVIRIAAASSVPTGATHVDIYCKEL